MIKREHHIKPIRPFYFVMDLVKIITGVRRSGKSVLLSQIADEVRESGVDESRIIYINFELFEYSELTDPKKLHKHIVAKTKKKEKYFVFIDEVQVVDKFEQVINSLRTKGNISVFITGSNAYLLSGELAKILSNKLMRFSVTPFTFSEALQISGESDKKKAFANYMMWGGLPGHFVFQNDVDKQKFLQDVFNSLIYRDIIQRAGIRDFILLEIIVQFMIENTSRIYSINTIAKHLKQNNKKVSAEALYNYVEYLMNSLLFTRVNRLDLKSKKMLSTNAKYYIADLGLLQITRGSQDAALGARFETIIANELLARGYKIYVGVKRNAEIDFVAQKNGETEYIQAAYTIASDDTLNREIGAFDGIPEKKTLITLDDYNYSAKGVKSVNAIEWLLD